MHISEQNRPQEITKLGLNNNVVDLILQRGKYGEFEEYFEDPSYYYDQGCPESPGDWPEFENKLILPLWQYCELLFVADLSCNEIEYFSFYIECPDGPSNYGNNIFLMIFSVIQWHCFQGVHDFDSAIEGSVDFMQKICFPLTYEFKSLF